MKTAKKLLAVLSLMCLLSTPLSCFAVGIPAGTPVYVSADNLIDADVVKMGEIVNFSTTEPVRVNGKVALPAGTKVTGKVTDVKNNGLVGIAGRIKCDNFKLITTKGETINLRGYAENIGNNRYWVNFGWIFLVTLPVLFVKGEDGKIEPHHSFLLYTLDDANVSL